MNIARFRSKTHAFGRNVIAALIGAAVGFSFVTAALAADTVTLRVGDQKGGNRSLLEISGFARDLPYRIEWSEFPAAAPILEALNAGVRLETREATTGYLFETARAASPAAPAAWVHRNYLAK